MNQVYLGLGANLGNPLQQCQQAIEFISQDTQIQITKKASFYKTKPLSCKNESTENTPWYINTCIEILTSYNPHDLLINLQNIEVKMGRTRDKKWESRLIDIDILFYNQEVISSKNITIPHPEVHKRSFTLIPLEEITPKFVHPQFDKSISQLISSIDMNEGEIIKVSHGFS